MRILMIHPHDLFSPSEPWTVRAKNLAREFISRGHSVTLVYFPLSEKDANKCFSLDGIVYRPLSRKLGLVVLLKNIIKVARLSKGVDVIHLQKCHYYASLPALISGWVNNKHLHYDWDDWETKIFYYSNPRHYLIGEFMNIFEKSLPKLADTVSVSSARLQGLCLKRGVSEENIFPAPVGADLGLFCPGKYLPGAIKRRYNIKQRLVLYVGQLHGAQYAEIFIQAARLILGRRTDTMFMVVGDGYRAPALKALVQRWQLSENFIFSGSIPHEDVPKYISDADVCVACFEDNDITRCKSPLKIAEYLASGKAIVASNVGEVKNMVGGVGVLAKPGDPVSLAEGIQRLLNDDELRAKLGKFARIRSLKQYNWAATAETLLKAYSKADPECYNQRLKKLIKRSGVMNDNFRKLTAEVVSVTAHRSLPYTVEFRSGFFLWKYPGAVTIDPRCTFYKNDDNLKDIDIIKPGDKIEVAYIMHNGIMVAFNIIVLNKR